MLLMRAHFVKTVESCITTSDVQDKNPKDLLIKATE